MANVLVRIARHRSGKNPEAAAAQRSGSNSKNKEIPTPLREKLLIAYGVFLFLFVAILFLKPFYCYFSMRKPGTHRWKEYSTYRKRDIAHLPSIQSWGDEAFHPLIPPGQKQPFLLYRLIGNDMPPLQCTGQLLTNTRYTLEFESRQLPDCRKIWVLNNILNDTARALLVDLFITFGYTVEDILIRRIDFSKIAGANRDRWADIVTAQNEARNFMIDHGKRQRGARWILPFDGNQFFTDEGWDSIRRAAKGYEKKGLLYFKVPMFRLYQEQSPYILTSTTLFPSLKDVAPGLWESQIAFRTDSTERFTLGLPYAKDNKLEFIDRVCGTAKFHLEKEGESSLVSAIDSKQCGCHREVGNDRKVRPFEPQVAMRCGFTIRLWYFPCPGVKTDALFVDPKYRRVLRKGGHDALMRKIEDGLTEWKRSQRQGERSQ